MVETEGSPEQFHSYVGWRVFFERVPPKCTRQLFPMGQFCARPRNSWPLAECSLVPAVCCAPFLLLVRFTLASPYASSRQAVYNFVCFISSALGRLNCGQK